MTQSNKKWSPTTIASPQIASSLPDSGLLRDLRALGRVLARPAYFFVALIASFLILGTLAWLFKLDALFYVFTIPFLSVGEKFNYFFSPYVNSFSFFFKDPVVASRLIFSALAGTCWATYLYVRQQSPTKVRGGLSGMTVALVSSTCIACGTSLLSPVLLALGAGSSVLIGATISTIGYCVAIVLMLFSLANLAKRV